MKCVINDYKVDVLPLRGVPNSRYYVPNGIGDNIDEYVTDKDGNFHKVCCSEGGDTITLTAGDGIEITGISPDFIITNTAPDQIVTLTEGSGIDITGTYPNFTIAATGGSSLRFGKAGEDDADTGNRLFTFTNPAGSNIFRITGSTSLGTGADFSMDTDFPSNTGTIRLLLASVGDGNSSFTLTGDGFTASTTWEFFTGIGNDVSIQLASGFMNFNLDANSLAKWTGVNQEDSLTRMLAIGAGGEMYWVDKATISGTPSRFAFSGEDDTAAENREFNTDGNDFIIAGSATQASYIALWSGTDIEIASTTGGGSPYIDIYVSPGNLFVDIDSVGGGGIFTLQGILQDDTATMLLALDGSDTVVWVDKSTLSGSSQRFGVSGEDDSSSVNRLMDMNGNDFAIIDTDSLTLTSTSTTISSVGGFGDVIVGADNTGLLAPVSYADVVAGGQVVIFEWRFDVSVGVNNPGSGNWRADSVVAASIATLSINDITNNTGVDISALFAAVDGNWLIHIQQSNDATKFIQFTTSGTYIDHTTWWEVPVTYVQHSGFPFGSNTKCTFVFVNENAGGGSQNLFETIVVAGQNNVVADSPTDTLTLVAGTGMTITTDDTTDTITFTAATSSSGIVRVIVSTSGSITLGSSAATDYTYFVTGAHTMSMPNAAGNTNRYTIKNNHSANITIDTAGAENIEGVASISIAPESSVDIISNGTDWFII